MSENHAVSHDFEQCMRILAYDFIAKKNKKLHEVKETDRDLAKIRVLSTMIKQQKTTLGPVRVIEDERPVYILCENKRKRQDPLDPDFLKYLARQWGVQYNCHIPPEVIESFPAFHARTLEAVSLARYDDNYILKCSYTKPVRALQDMIANVEHAVGEDLQNMAQLVAYEFLTKKNKVPCEVPDTELKQARLRLLTCMVDQQKSFTGPVNVAGFQRPVYIISENKRKRQDPLDPNFLKYLIGCWGVEYHCELPPEVIDSFPAFHAQTMDYISGLYPDNHVLKCSYKKPAQGFSDLVSGG